MGDANPVIRDEELAALGQHFLVQHVHGALPPKSLMPASAARLYETLTASARRVATPERIGAITATR